MLSAGAWHRVLHRVMHGSEDPCSQQGAACCSQACCWLLLVMHHRAPHSRPLQHAAERARLHEPLLLQAVRSAPR